MQKLMSNQMENITGGTKCSGTANAAISVIKDVSCIAASIWPIGTLIGGPTCVGMIIASAACAAN